MNVLVEMENVHVLNFVTKITFRKSRNENLKLCLSKIYTLETFKISLKNFVKFNVKKLGFEMELNFWREFLNFQV